MILIGNFLIAIGHLVEMTVSLFIMLIFAYVVCSWVNADPYNPLVRFITGSVEPLMIRVRKYVRPIGMFDLSPIVALFGLYFISYFIAGSLLDYGYAIKDSSKRPISSEFTNGF